MCTREVSLLYPPPSLLPILRLSLIHFSLLSFDTAHVCVSYVTMVAINSNGRYLSVLPSIISFYLFFCISIIVPLLSNYFYLIGTPRKGIPPISYKTEEENLLQKEAERRKELYNVCWTLWLFPSLPFLSRSPVRPFLLSPSSP